MGVIEFRGKRVDNKEWVYGSCFIEQQFTCFHSNPKYYIITQHFMDWNLWSTKSNQVIRGTVGQFTGAIDINKNKIYKYDIVKGPCSYGDYDEDFDNGVVLWSEEDYGFGIWREGKIHHKNYLCNLKTGLEVVGNIFDNPQLLDNVKRV